MFKTISLIIAIFVLYGGAMLYISKSLTNFNDTVKYGHTVLKP